jgi:hypothetical protein
MLDTIPFGGGNCQAKANGTMLSREPNPMSILSAPYFHNEAAAYEFVEVRLWQQARSARSAGLSMAATKLDLFLP